MILRKLSEEDLKYPTLYILHTKGSMTISQLKDEILNMLNPSGDNLKPLLNRSDTAITQIIRNMVCHRNDSRNNIINQGLVVYNQQTQLLSITNRGINDLNSFLVKLLTKNLE